MVSVFFSALVVAVVNALCRFLVALDSDFHFDDGGSNIVLSGLSTLSLTSLEGGIACHSLTVKSVPRLRHEAPEFWPSMALSIDIGKASHLLSITAVWASFTRFSLEPQLMRTCVVDVDVNPTPRHLDFWRPTTLDGTRLQHCLFFALTSMDMCIASLDSIPFEHHTVA
ncbi:hypothetical protein BDZ89DRAFT_1141445 [Hymenopellis radicata]|nr:hypothetical protein BDZ89DRAFT_1141445 [Hymenopellis radicata]